MFELDVTAQDEVDRGIEEDGSNLSGVSARCSWSELNHLFSLGTGKSWHLQISTKVKLKHTLSNNPQHVNL